MRREEKICEMMDFSIFNISQDSNLDVDNNVVSLCQLIVDRFIVDS